MRIAEIGTVSARRPLRGRAVYLPTAPSRLLAAAGRSADVALAALAVGPAAALVGAVRLARAARAPARGAAAGMMAAVHFARIPAYTAAAALVGAVHLASAVRIPVRRAAAAVRTFSAPKLRLGRGSLVARAKWSAAAALLALDAALERRRAGRIAADLPAGPRGGSAAVAAARLKAVTGPRRAVAVGAAALILTGFGGTGLGDGSAARFADVATPLGIAPPPPVATLARAVPPVPRRKAVKEAARLTHLSRPAGPALLAATALPSAGFVRRAPVPGRAPERAASAPPAASALPQGASAYAADGVDIAAPFALLLDAPALDAPALSRPLPEGVAGNGLDAWWSDRPLPADVASERSVKCLAQAVYFEARGEDLRGRQAVAQVVMNRVKSPAYPDDVCGVVYQNRSWFNRCQFTFACDSHPDVVTDPAAWADAEGVARAYVVGETWLPEIGAATHYHTTAVSPAWSKTLRALRTVGAHVFYMGLGDAVAAPAG